MNLNVSQINAITDKVYRARQQRAQKEFDEKFDAYMKETNDERQSIKDEVDALSDNAKRHVDVKYLKNQVVDSFYKNEFYSKNRVSVSRDDVKNEVIIKTIDSVSLKELMDAFGI